MHDATLGGGPSNTSSKRSLIRVCLVRLARRPWQYWLRAAMFGAVAIWLNPMVARTPTVANLKGQIFQAIAQLNPRPMTPDRTRVVMIDDLEYWRGPPQARVPLSRSYLAELIQKLVAAGAPVIALDVSEALPQRVEGSIVGDFSLIPRDLRDDSDQLVRAILAAATQQRKIVLGKTFVPGTRMFARDLFEIYGLCVEPNGQGEWLNPGAPGFEVKPEMAKNISCGHLSPTRSRISVPLQFQMTDSSAPIDSFSLAIARALDPDAARQVDPRGGITAFIPVAAEKAAILLAVDVRSAPATDISDRVRARAAIIGGDWHSDSYGGSQSSDEFMTPLGQMSGVFLHDNYAETIIGHRLIPSLDVSLEGPGEVIVAILAVIMFAIFDTFWAKFLILSVLTAVILIIEYFVLTMFGVFLNIAAVILALFTHSLIERLLEGGGRSGSFDGAVDERELT